MKVNGATRAFYCTDETDQQIAALIGPKGNLSEFLRRLIADRFQAQQRADHAAAERKTPATKRSAT